MDKKAQLVEVALKSAGGEARPDGIGQLIRIEAFEPWKNNEEHLLKASRDA